MDIRAIMAKRKLIFDGGMGTFFAECHPEYGDICEMANIDCPENVLEVHEAYLKAGCDVIKTNTFSVNPLNPHFAGKDELLEQVIKAGYAVAEGAAASAGATVFADIGPAPAGCDAEAEEKAQALIKAAAVFLDCGAQNFIFETNSSDEGLAEAAAYIKSRCGNAFIIASFAVQPDGYTRDGMYINDIFRRISASADIDALGLNCVSSALHMKMLAESLDEVDKPLCVMPNAGYPKVIGGRVFYDSDPQYFAEQVAQMAAAGAAAAGGCCGTTPDYIRCVADALKRLNGEKAPARVRPAVRSRAAAERAIPDSVNDHNIFAEKLDAGRKVIAVELDPPRSADSAKFMSGAWSLKAAGADIITIADCATARASMDSSLMACKIRRELGIDALPHMTCRDRNLNATKALLLGLSTEGISNVLVITGDPVPTAERDEVKSVFQFNSAMLAAYIRSLNETELSRPFRVYGALNINARNFEPEMKKAVKKVDSGISGFLTQPVLTEAAAENLRIAHERLAGSGVKLLGGIIPVVSSRNGRFMNSEISGINVDEKIIDMYEGLSRDECTELAVRISCEIADRIAPYTDGYYLMTPFSRTDIITRIIEHIRKPGL